MWLVLGCKSRYEPGTGLSANPIQKSKRGKQRPYKAAYRRGNPCCARNFAFSKTLPPTKQQFTVTIYFNQLLLFSILFLALTACTQAHIQDDVASAIADRVIMPMGRAANWEPDFELVEVQRRNLERTDELLVQARFSVTQNLSFDGYGGVYSGAHIEEGERVPAGLLLGEQFFQEIVTEPLKINRYRLALQLSVLDEDIRRENNAHSREVQEARNALASLDYHGREIANMRITRLQLQHQQFTLRSQDVRRNIQRQLDEIDSQLQGMRIYAPFDGLLTFVSSMSPEMEVPPGFLFFTIADERYVHFTVTAAQHMVIPGTVHTIWDFENRFSFDARVISGQPSSMPPPPGSGDILMDFTLVPQDITAFTEMLESLDITIPDLLGMDLRITATQTLAHNILLLPGRAVRREDLAYYVMVYNDGRLAKRYITRGQMHQFYMEIIMGVEEGWKVALP
ncbi:MAG: hypothetical protein FWE42_02655 [Defluviitaleaceae bacterium]|nr:hypothetical protein [Defluviitaleaceae bacterium]